MFLCPKRYGLAVSLLTLCLVMTFTPRLFAQAVLINELMTSNDEAIADEHGAFPDWFELHNPGKTDISLREWGVTDDADRPFKWTIGDFTLKAGGFLLVFASGENRQPGLLPSIAPTNVSGLKLWLRAQTVNTNDAGEVRLYGSTIFLRRWDDVTSSGNNASAVLYASQPVWVPDLGNGKPAIRFDGRDDRMLLPRPVGTNDFCFFIVFRATREHEVDPEGSGSVAGTSGQRYLFGASHGGDFAAGAGLSVGTNGVSVYEHGSSYMPPLAVHAGYIGNDVTVVAMNYEGRRPTLDLQGSAVRKGLGSGRETVTAPVEIGSGAYGAFKGDIIEILGYDRALTEEERRAIAGYLARENTIPIAQPFHASFELSASGEELQLTRPDGTVADQVKFGPIPRAISYGRQPDGSASFLFFGQPTAGGGNVTPGSAEFLSVPSFSHEGGFYSTNFDLTLSASSPGAEVRYTLDGSEPTEASALYSLPLAIRSRAGTPNGISTIPTVPGGPMPSGEVFKGWVVRARTYKTGALPSAVKTRSFWVHSRGRGRYTLPVLSLTTASSNLFHAQTGIYVPGTAPNGNYSQRGPEWQRPVHVEFFETNNLLAFAQEADVKIHGNTSQGFPVKGLDLDGTGGNGRRPFRYQIFPDRPRNRFEHFLLRPTGHDQQMAFMRDELMQSLAAETGAESQAARACIVFINGEYWGLHYLKEKEDVAFVSFYGDYPEDSLDYLEGYAAAKAGDVAHYQQLTGYVGANDMKLPAVYERVGSLMEIPNYMDYKICEIFFYRWDIGNHRLWRPRTPNGRWRWLQFDNDVGWGGFWAEQPAWAFNMLLADLTPNGSLHDHNNETTTFLLRRLVQNPEFKRDFINRFADLLNTLFITAHTVERINDFAAVLDPEMAEHTRRWRAPASLTEWRSNVQYLRTFATNRPSYVRQHLQQVFGLGPLVKLNLGSANTNEGSIRLNTLSITAPSNAPWAGMYFKGHPVTLTAVPEPGFQFSRWEGITGQATVNAIVIPQGEIKIVAHFEPEVLIRPKLTSLAGSEDQTILLLGTGQPGRSYILESSIDLIEWIPGGAIVATSTGDIQIEDSRVGPQRFYRLRIR